MENNMLIYQDENGITKVSVRLDEDDIWLTQNSNFFQVFFKEVRL